MPMHKTSQVRATSGASLGAMLILLDLRPEMLADSCGSRQLNGAMERCLDCATHVVCARWLADRDRRPDSWRGFCPNAALLAKAQSGARRLG